MSETNVRIQDDLYEAVNGEWLKTAVIPEDRPITGGFSELDQGVEKIMMADFAAFAKGEKSCDITGMEDAVRLYRKVLDVERRNSEGLAPVLPLLAQIRSIDSVQQLNAQAYELMLKGVDLPVQIGVEADMKNASVNALFLMGPDIILPDTSYYGQPNGDQLLEVYRSMAAEALKHTDLSEEEQKAYVDDTIAYDGLVGGLR